MNKYLKNPKTGQVLRSTPTLERDTFLVPCDLPWVKGNEEDATKGQGKTIIDDNLVSKEDGASLVKEWFGRAVGRVTIEELQTYAAENDVQLEDDSMTKLEIVRAIDAGLREKE